MSTTPTTMHTPAREWRGPIHYQGRPGAMDAFALPSLINGRRVGRAAIDAAKGEPS